MKLCIVSFRIKIQGPHCAGLGWARTVQYSTAQQYSSAYNTYQDSTV